MLLYLVSVPWQTLTKSFDLVVLGEAYMAK